MKNGYIQCIHARTNVLGACDWGVDYEGNVVGGCEVETPKPTHEIIAVPAPTHANTAPEPECCRAKVFTPELKSMYDNLCRKKSYVQCYHSSLDTTQGACKWGIDTEGNHVDGCVVQTPKPTPAVTAPVTAPVPQCCRAAVFTPETKNMYDNLCRNKSYVQCYHSSLDTTMGACKWGVDTEGNQVDGCNVQTPVTTPTTLKPTPSTCAPLKNCVVKGGEKVFGWVNAGGRKKASSACACAEHCEQMGGTEAKYHVKRQICKCWKQSSSIELKSEPFDANRKHGGNAGGKTECVKMAGSVAEGTEEKTPSPTNEPTSAPTNEPTNAPTKSPTNEPTSAPTKSPTNDPTSSPTKSPTYKPTRTPTAIVTKKPTLSAEECEKKKQAFLNGPMATWCNWQETYCRVQCA